MFLNGKGSSGHASINKIVKPFTVSLLALAVHAFIHPAQAAENTQQNMVVYGSTENTADDPQDYAAKTTRAGTKMLLAPRDVPQSVSIV